MSQAFSVENKKESSGQMSRGFRCAQQLGVKMSNGYFCIPGLSKCCRLLSRYQWSTFSETFCTPRSSVNNVLSFLDLATVELTSLFFFLQEAHSSLRWTKRWKALFPFPFPFRVVSYIFSHGKHVNNSKTTVSPSKPDVILFVLGLGNQTACFIHD